MPKVIYTETDIEDMVKRGGMSLEINDNVMLTDLAYEKAKRLGVKLVHDKPENPPAAPVRPYVVQQTPQNQLRATGGVDSQRPVATDLAQRIRKVVLERMGNQVDPALLDVIIQRVLTSTGVK